MSPLSHRKYVQDNIFNILSTSGNKPLKWQTIGSFTSHSFQYQSIHVSK
jgi:hypothetical protein